MGNLELNPEGAESYSPLGGSGGGSGHSTLGSGKDFGWGFLS